MSEIYGQGDFAKVPEVAAAAVVLAAFILWRWVGGAWAGGFLDFARGWFRELNVQLLDQAGFVMNVRGLIASMGIGLSGILFASALAAIVANGMQTSFRLSPKALEPKFSKLDPLKGIKRLVGKQKIVQLLIEVSKFFTIAVVLAVLIWNLRRDPIFEQIMPVEYLTHFMVSASTQLGLGLLLTLIVIAAVHFTMNKKVKQDEWKMTKQEVRDEHKQQEGSPDVKRGRRQAAMQMHKRRMLEQIPLADVVVTNPTHYAIVLKYDPKNEDAPRVIAKGARSRAQHLKKIAAKHGIPMVENKMVARGLYRSTAVGQVIPGEFFPAVAGILSFVYRNYKYHCAEVKRRRAAQPVKGAA
jgi:flagellar biosynthetic protein FlhB